MIQSVGDTLQNALRKCTDREERVKFKESVKLQVLQGLQELHSRGFAYCDLHVGNVFVIEDWVFLDDLEYLTPIDDSPPTKRYSFRLSSGMKAREVDVKQYEAFVSDLIAL